MGAMPSILIATDDTALYTVLSAECAGEGHATLWAANGHEAVELTLAHAPDLIFLDIALAIFNGIEACAMLREDPGVPGSLAIYLLTDDEVNPNTLLRCGATGIFPKTHAGSELRELLAQELQHADRLSRAWDALRH